MTKFSCTVSADLLARAYAAVSTEETRYYLNGVNIEPHPEGGALLVPTNGSTMLVFRDHEAKVTGQAIVQADKGALQAMRKRDPWGARKVTVKGEQLTVHQPAPTQGQPDITVYIQAGECFIDGSFPDWRRVIPDLAKCTARPDRSFNPLLLAEIGKALNSDPKVPAISIFAEGDREHPGPNVVIGSTSIPGFGIVMPVRDLGREPKSFASFIVPKPVKEEAANDPT